MSEELLLRHCSPTLAALKAGSLFTCPSEFMPILEQVVKTWNEQLNAKGVQVLVLLKRKRTALVYVYRPTLLKIELAKFETQQLLSSYGYPLCQIETTLSFLKDKLTFHEEFPHEIGVFLGYPPEDVRLFIENKGCNGKCDGCWKVYDNEVDAKQRFAQFKKCTALYLRMHKQGKSLDSLAVKKVYL